MTDLSTRVSLVRGAILGALCGDAAGAVLEFMGGEVTPALASRALTFPGGGVWGVAPGQVTDDGELTLALARALSGQVTYPREAVARRYRDWFTSAPFDVGGTTAAALSGHAGRRVDLADVMDAQAARSSASSKANGSLMRASGLGAWAWRLSLEDAAEAARADARLTHPNRSCQDAGAAYVVAIRHLVLHPDDAEGAFAAACGVVREDEVARWLDDARAGRLPPCSPQDGFVRIAFTHAFGHLLRRSGWSDAMAEVLAGGGDTDTNACIVGGLVGARVGEAGLPEAALSAVLSCDTARGNPRPDWLRTRDALALADVLAT